SGKQAWMEQTICEARSRHSEHRARSACRSQSFALSLSGGEVQLISNAQVQRKVRLHFPIVFEEPAQLVLMPLAKARLAGKKHRILPARRIVGLSRVQNGSAQIRQQILRAGLVAAKVDARAQIDRRS